MKKECIVLTGYSRGIGEALRHILPERFLRIFLGRSEPLGMRSSDVWVPWDLSQRANAEQHSQIDALQNQDLDFRAVLHVAGVTGHLGAQIRTDEAELAMRVNYLAFVQILQWFLPKLRECPGESLVAHLSSGAAQAPYPDLSDYCAAKAAVLMRSRCLAEEVPPMEALILSVAPGVVATGMTAPLVTSDATVWPRLQKFRELHASGKLKTAEESAQELLDILFAEKYRDLRFANHGKYLDVREIGTK